MTIVPLYHCDPELSVPARINLDTTAESVRGLLRPEVFDLWRDYISKRDRDDLASMRIGLVHRFLSQEYVHSKPEADSSDLAYKAFLLLRLIKPTRSRFSRIQLALKEGQPDVFSFTQPGPTIPNTPNLETFNRINDSNVSQLSNLLPRFLKFADSAPWHLTRAARFFEAGYSQISDPLLQFTAWTTAIESFFSEDKAPLSKEELADKIRCRIDGATDIHSDVDVNLLAYPLKPVPLNSLLPDIFEARNCVVHGVRIPPSFDERGSTSPATGEMVHYVDVLREGASFLLRKLLLKAIGEIDA
jgi:hypothetical protein